MNEIYSERRLNELVQININPQNNRASAFSFPQLKDQRDPLNIQTYVFGQLTELANVDLVKKSIQCKFVIYVTIVLDFQDSLYKIIQQSLQYSNSEQNEYYLRQRNRILTFLKKHLIVECGKQTVNYAEQQHYERFTRQIQKQQEQKDKQQNLQQDDQDQDQQDDSEEQQKFVCKKLPNNAGSKSLTFKIVGKFKCICKLQNFLFPYYYINSGLKITVRRQYLDGYIFNYVIQSFKERQIEGNQFTLNCHPQSKFRDCQINWDKSTFGTQYSIIYQQPQFLNQKLYDTYQQIQRSKGSIGAVTFKFQIFSFNIPFIFRQLVPIIILSFASLMIYFANATQLQNLYANVILLSITLVQQISNFRRSQFTGTQTTFFEAHIIGQITINFLLMIITTSNFYKDWPAQTNKEKLNSFSAIFWISVGIASFFVVLTFIYLVYYFYKSKTSYSNYVRSDQLLRNSRVWNEQTSGNIDNFLDIECKY